MEDLLFLLLLFFRGDTIFGLVLELFISCCSLLSVFVFAFLGCCSGLVGVSMFLDVLLNMMMMPRG